MIDHGKEPQWPENASGASRFFKMPGCRSVPDKIEFRKRNSNQVSPIWTFENDRDDFGEVFEAEHSDAPQVVTRNGKAAAVVLSPEQYNELLEQARRHGDPFVQHLLAIP